MGIDQPSGGFERALAMVPACTLDADGRGAQKARYDKLAQSVTAVRREPERVAVEFAERVDRVALEEAIAVERECCPWLRFEFDESDRRLAVTVTDAAMMPTLDVVEVAFAARQ